MVQATPIHTRMRKYTSKAQAVNAIVNERMHPTKTSKRSFDNVSISDIIDIIDEYDARNTQANHTQETHNMTETTPVAPVQPTDIESMIKAAVAAALAGMMPTGTAPITQSAPVAPAPVKTYQPAASYVNMINGSQMDTAINQYLRAMPTRKLIVYRPIAITKQKRERPISLTIVFDIQHRTFTAIDYYVSPETGNVTVQVGGRYGNNVFSTCDDVETWLNGFKSVSPQMRSDIVNLCRTALSR